MLDAFIIDQVNKQREKTEKWEPSQATIPLEEQEEEQPVKDETKSKTIIQL